MYSRLKATVTVFLKVDFNIVIVHIIYQIKINAQFGSTTFNPHNYLRCCVIYVSNVIGMSDFCRKHGDLTTTAFSTGIVARVTIFFSSIEEIYKI